MKKTKEKFVTTYSGEELPISKCKKINAVYYKVGDPSIENSGDCYLMGDKKYYLNDGSLIYDHEYNSYVIVKYTKNVIQGVIGFDEKKEPILGNFTANKTNNCVICLKNGKKHILINKDIIFRDNVFNRYREELMSGDFYHIETRSAHHLTNKRFPKSEYKQSLPYDSKGKTSTFEKYYKNNNLEINTISKKLNNIFKDYTFGLEFETTKGFLTNRECIENGLMPLRDGSITGIEYVTIPLQGEKGAQTIQNAVKILKEKTEFDDQCSLHLHIGNIPRTEEFILAFFVTTALLQNDLFESFPLYKKYNFGYKNKNYSAPYPVERLLASFDCSIDNSNIKTNFSKLFEFLSEGTPYETYLNDLSQVNTHPKNPDDNHKWQVNTRYFIHNLIPIIFGNKQTIEFRIHTPTYDINKIIAFITLNIQIIQYVKDNSTRILKEMNITPLYHIVTANYSNGEELSFLEYVYDYFIQRKRFNERQYKYSKLYFNEDDVPCNFNINILDKTLKYVTGNNNPFTGIVEQFKSKPIGNYYSIKIEEAYESEKKSSISKKEMKGIEKYLNAVKPNGSKPVESYSWQTIDLEKYKGGYTSGKNITIDSLGSVSTNSVQSVILEEGEETLEF